MAVDKVGGHVDTILQVLGPTGRYQMLQMIISLSPTLAAAIQLLGNVFICKDVPHACRLPSNVTTPTMDEFLGRYGNYSNVGVSNLGDCGLKVTSNGTQVDVLGCVFGNHYDLDLSVSAVSEFDLVCDNAYLAKLSQTLVIIGQGVGAVLTTIASDRLGRKMVLVAANMGLLVCGLIIAYSPHFLVFAVFKFIIGGFQQGILTGTFTFNAELFDTKSRRLNAVVCSLFWATGVMLLPLISYVCQDLSWRSTQAIYCTMNITILLQIAFMDESLRWLLANGRSKDAVKVIKKAARMNHVQVEKVMIAYNRDENSDTSASSSSSQINAPSETQVLAISHKRLSLLDILCMKRMLFNACAIWFAWFTTAISFFAIYMTSTSLAGNPYLNFFLISTMEVPSCIFFYFFLNRLGRKWTTACVFSCVAIGLLTRGIFQSFEPNPTHDTIILISTMVGMAGASGCFGAVFSYTPEMFPTNVRNQALGLSSFMGRIGGMLAPFTAVLAAKASWAPGILIGCLAIIVMVLLTFLPETNGRELPQTIEDLQRWYTKDKDTEAAVTRKEKKPLMADKEKAEFSVEKSGCGTSDL